VELLLIRHALPQRLDAGTGPADPSLDVTGRAQAAALARWLGPQGLDGIVTSPLRRAVETAEPLAGATGLRAEVVSGLAEWDRNATRYIPLEQLRTEDPATFAALRAGRLADLGVDTDAFCARVEDAMASVVADYPGGRVAVVCHGGVINAFLSMVLRLDRLVFFPPAYTSVSRVAVSRNGERGVLSLNEVPHLNGSA
jgi:broad specificity phosphatase PhoE